MEGPCNEREATSRTELAPSLVGDRGGRSRRVEIGLSLICIGMMRVFTVVESNEGFELPSITIALACVVPDWDEV